MEKLNNLIKIKEENLSTQERELSELKSNMSDPRTINTKADFIKERKHELELMKDFINIAKENNNDIIIAREIMKESLQDIKEDSVNYSHGESILKEAVIDEQTIESLITYAQADNTKDLSDKQNTIDIVQTDYSFLDDID